LLALKLQSQPGAVGLQTPPLVPAPIFVYLQLPEELITASVGKTGLWWAGSAPLPAPEAAAGAAVSLVSAGSSQFAAKPLVAGLRVVLGPDATSRIPLALSPSAGFPPDGADLRFGGGPAPLPAILPSAFFAIPAPTWKREVRADLSAQDDRFDRFVREEERPATRQRLQQIMNQKAAQRALMAEGPTVTLPVEAVQPALNLLAAVSSSILARQQQGEDLLSGASAPVAPISGGDVVPRLAAGLARLAEAPGPRPENATREGSLSQTAHSLPGASAGVRNSLAPAASSEPPANLTATSAAPNAASNAQDNNSSAPLAAAGTPEAQLGARSEALCGLPSAPASGLVPGAPALPATPPAALSPADPGGLPSGWPENVPYPPSSAAEGAPSATAAPVAGGGPSLPGMPAINGNVYMFGNEINASSEADDTSQALVKRDSDTVPAPPEAETEAEKPNFTRPGGGFPLSGGGTMNVGTMVVVNQPSGTVNINASSPTAATFESRLRQKGPAPLSSIAEAVGLQMPVPLAPKEMPLRMNFQGRLEMAMPVKWPDLSPVAMRKKMFLGSPAKARKADPAEAYAVRPISSHPGAGRSAPAAPPPLERPAADTGEDKSGAMGWIKSFSSRFGKK